MYMICVLRDTLYFFYTVLYYLSKKKKNLASVFFSISMLQHLQSCIINLIVELMTSMQNLLFVKSPYDK
jgi:hypothetical protein